MEEEKDVSNAQILWSACQALARAMKTMTDTKIKPLEPEIKAVFKAARKCLNLLIGYLLFGKIWNTWNFENFFFCT